MAFPNLAVRPTVPPMETKSVDELPPEEAGAWRYEPKWDGFRCLVFKDGDEVELQSKGEKPLGRYFPEVVALFRALPADRFVVDGELVIPVSGALSFDALQMRLHPAESRIKKLSVQTPARLILFDCLAAGGRSLLEAPLAERRAALEGLGLAGKDLLLSPWTQEREQAQSWLDAAGVALDGVIAKRADGPYLPGERAMLKVKCLRTADCVVGGFRYLAKPGAGGKREVGSLLLGLHDAEGRLNHVGFTSNMPSAERPELTKRLEAMVEPPGFTGSAPGGPSRWSTERSTEWHPLRPELVVEVRFDQVTAGRFRHGTSFLRWRPDKAPAQCRMEQMDHATPLSAIEDLGRSGQGKGP